MVNLVKKIFWVLIVTSFVLTSISSFSEDKPLDASVYINNNNGLPFIVINGYITKKTILDLERLIRKAPSNKPIIITLNSLGGSVEEAIKGGYLLRRYSAHVAISNESTCASACVFLLAGATSRGVGGRVGIHRPYEPNDKIESATAQKLKYEPLGVKIKQFFSDVNIPSTLYDEMLRIPPRAVKYLSEDDLSRTGLGQDDPYYAEAESSKAARNWGVSKQEYERRMNMINTVCATYSEEEKTNCMRNVYNFGHE